MNFKNIVNISLTFNYMIIGNCKDWVEHFY